MLDDSSYTREIEKHFLSKTGSGIMLSSRDYDLIHKWKQMGVPKEVLYKGINRAIEEFFKKRDGQYPRSIYYCSQTVEEEIRRYFRSAKQTVSDTETGSNTVYEEVLERLAKMISTEKNKKIRRHYKKTRDKVFALSGLDEIDLYKKLESIQEQFFDELFGTLAPSEKESILKEAEGMIYKGGRYMTDDRYRESLASLRNQIIRERFNIRKILWDF